MSATFEDKKIVFVDYFKNYDPPSIITENNLLLKGSLIKALAGPLIKGAYAQAANQGALSIGEVSNVTGTVKVTRLDGSNVNLNVGDPVFQGDDMKLLVRALWALFFWIKQHYHYPKVEKWY